MILPLNSQHIIGTKLDECDLMLLKQFSPFMLINPDLLPSMKLSGNNFQTVT